MERRRPEPTLPNVAATHPPRHLLARPDTGLIPTRSHTASSPACHVTHYISNPSIKLVTCRSLAGSVADPDPGSGAFLTPGSGMAKKFFDADPGSAMEKIRIRIWEKFESGIRDKRPGSATLLAG